MRTSIPLLLVAAAAPALLCGACDNGLFALPTPLKELPAGSLEMGSTKVCQDDQGIACAGDRAPHLVRLSGFSIEMTEVTRLQYANCVVDGRCRETAALPFDRDHKDDPVLVNDPAAARDYCAWRGRQLPTEAQFEYAARVGKDGKAHDYPWGDETPTCDRVAFRNCGQSLARPVGTTAGDTSEAGVLDLAGSAPEWVEDAYDARTGCLARTAWSDICAQGGPGCPSAHCIDNTCVRGCLPPDVPKEPLAGAATSDEPHCQQVSAGEVAPFDPVVRTGSEFGIIRGGSALDGRCKLAGWSRRHAAPGTTFAGFRCVALGTPSTPPGAYRFTLAGCPTPDHPVTIQVGDDENSGLPVDFLLDHAGARGPFLTVHADGGAVRMMPCGDSFVVRPTRPVVLRVEVTDYLGCATWSQKVGLRNGGDVPARGTQLLDIAGSGSCMLPNAVGSCAGGCRIDSCAAGFDDCDGGFANGCEKDVRNDQQNCGACGHGCTSSPNAIVACLDGTCGVAACSQRFSDCDARLDNGCEIDTTTDPTNCGACRTVCSHGHISTPTCTAGVCGGTCDPGFTDCNGSKLEDGCEISTASDPAHCGGCGMACSSKNIAAACTGGSCTGRCAPNHGDCNNDKRADGCESALETDVKNCGSCGNACPQGKSCVAGQCQ